MMERWRSGGPRLGPESTEVLRSRLGNPRWIRQLPSSPRSQVWLAEFDGSPAVVKQVLVVDRHGVDEPGVDEQQVHKSGADKGKVHKPGADKREVDEPDVDERGVDESGVVEPGVDERSADERFGREVTALRLAARVHPPVVPVLLATLPGARLLVLERLTDHRPRTGWVEPWARALARLHASTGPADVGSLPAWRGPGPADVRAFLGLAAQLGVPVSSGVPAELDHLLDRLQAGTGHALLHGDPCPGNDLYQDGSARFVDLEAASLGSGLVELAYLRIGFPTCWCVIVVPDEELLAAEASYRQTYRSATGTEPAGDLTDACVGWLISGDALVERAERGPPEHLVDHLAAAVRRDWKWGTATARQRLAHRLTVVAGLCAERDDLGELGRLCVALRARMGERWPTLARLPLVRPG